MGANTAIPFGEEEAKAFKLFMKKFTKNHSNQNLAECTLNAKNAWGKLTPEQKMLFAVMPKPIAYRRKMRCRVSKKKKAGKQKKVVYRAAKPMSKKTKRKLSLAQQLKNVKYRKPVRRYV